MKEIGGYFQLEEMPGEEYYPDLYRVNLGRTALLWLLKSRRCRKILLPYFLCESVVHTCQENQIETEFYHLNEKLEVRKGNIFIWLITMVSCLIPGYQSIKRFTETS